MKLKIGDKFTNTKGSVCNIVNIHTYGRKAEVSSSNWQSNGHYSVEDIVDKIRSGVYKDYKSITDDNDSWIPQVNEWIVIQDSTINFNSTMRKVVGQVFQITKVLSDGNSYQVRFKGIGQHWSWQLRSKHFRKALPHEIPTSDNPDMIRTWKKEDFLNTKIEVDNPKKSKRFQEFLLQFGLQFNGGPDYFDSPFLFIEKTGTLMYGQLLSTFKGEENREIKYSEIFSNNNQSITTNENNSKNTNDLSSTHLTGNRREETATAIAFSKTSRIASSSRYIGNTVKGRSTPTRIGRSEIKFQAVTA